MVLTDCFCLSTVPSSELTERTNGWQNLADEYDLPLPAVAMAFAALPKCVTKVVLGMSAASDVEENVGLLPQTAVPPMLWREAKARGLLDSAVPTS